MADDDLPFNTGNSFRDAVLTAVAEWNADSQVARSLKVGEGTVTAALKRAGTRMRSARSVNRLSEAELAAALRKLGIVRIDTEG